MTRNADNITAIYDAGPEVWDRYTVFIDDSPCDEALCLSLCLGYSEFANAEQSPALGTPVAFDDLPEHLQRHIMRRMNYAEMVEAAARNREATP